MLLRSGRLLTCIHARQEPAIGSTDRISSLPDELLCHLLSFLPTQDAVATTALSRRWRHLWKYLQVFAFSGEYCDDAYYVAFFQGFLANRRVRGFRKLQLITDLTSNDKDAAAKLVDAAVGPHIQELNITLYQIDKLHLTPRVFACCTSLVSLTLCGFGIFLPPQLSSVHLPALKNLCLDVERSYPVDKILSGCPVLETLEVKLHYQWYATTIVVPRSLKKLTFESTVEDAANFGCLEIDAPCLEYLYVEIKCGYSQVLVSDFPNLVRAYVDISFCSEENVSFAPKVLMALCGSKSLELAFSTCEDLFRAPAQDIPEFCCLLHLKLHIPCLCIGFLIELLRHCPVLQVLVIYSFGGPAYPPKWMVDTNEPTSVPSCVTSHLKTFVFCGYKGTEEEHAVAAYILERGLVLEKMTIRTTGYIREKEKHHILNALEELSLIPRGFNMCQLKFE